MSWKGDALNNQLHVGEAEGRSETSWGSKAEVRRPTLLEPRREEWHGRVRPQRARGLRFTPG